MIEKINNNKILFFLANFLNTTIIVMITYILVDLFSCNVIYKKEFIFSVDRHLISQIMVGFFTAVFLIAMKINDEKKTKSTKK